MTGCDRGDVVLVNFVFSDESGTKLRPVLVISSADYNRGRLELIVVAITSNVRRRLFGDHRVADWKEAGLFFPSVVTGIFRTVQREMVQRRLGSLTRRDLRAVEDNLRKSLGLAIGVSLDGARGGT